MPDAGEWLTRDGLKLLPVAEKRWRVEVVRELPERLGVPVSVELPREGAKLSSGETLLAIELSKARVEFEAPADLIVCEARHDFNDDGQSETTVTVWHLVIEV